MITAMVALLASHTWIGGQFQDLKDGMKDVGTRLERIEERQEEAWTQQNMRVWTLRLERGNPTLKVPEWEK